jgi:hypothetical protein
MEKKDTEGLSATDAWALTQYLCRAENRPQKFSLRGNDGVVTTEPIEQLGLMVGTAIEFLTEHAGSERYEHLLQKNLVLHARPRVDAGAFTRFKQGRIGATSEKWVRFAHSTMEQIYFGPNARTTVPETKQAFQFLSDFLLSTKKGDFVPRFFSRPRNLHASAYSRRELSLTLQWLANQASRLDSNSGLMIVSGSRGFTNQARHERDHLLGTDDIQRLLDAGVSIELVGSQGESDCVKCYKWLKGNLRANGSGSDGKTIRFNLAQQNGSGFLNDAFLYLYFFSEGQGRSSPQASNIICVRATDETESEEPLTFSLYAPEVSMFKDWCVSVLGRRETALLKSLSA